MQSTVQVLSEYSVQVLSNGRGIKPLSDVISHFFVSCWYERLFFTEQILLDGQITWLKQVILYLTNRWVRLKINYDPSTPSVAQCTQIGFLLFIFDYVLVRSRIILQQIWASTSITFIYRLQFEHFTRSKCSPSHDLRANPSAHTIFVKIFQFSNISHSQTKFNLLISTVCSNPVRNYAHSSWVGQYLSIATSLVIFCPSSPHFIWTMQLSARWIPSKIFSLF